MNKPAGRPKLLPQLKKRVTSVTLRPDDILLFEILGDGNVSAGVTEAANILRTESRLTFPTPIQFEEVEDIFS